MIPIIPKFKNKLNDSQISKVREVSDKLYINPNWLLAVFFFETGGTFSPSKINSIGSVGLIQFTRDKKGVEYKTILGKKYLLSDLAKMSFIEQMDVVFLYYKEVLSIYKTSLNSFIDVYLATFFPLAISKSDDFVFETKGLSASLIAKQNPGFDTNKDGKITKKEVLSVFAKYYGTIFTEIKKKV